MDFGLHRRALAERKDGRQRRRPFAAFAFMTACVFAPLNALAQSSFYNPDDPPSADQVAIGTAPLPKGPPLVGDQVCNRLARCLEILDNHPPDSFDYDLLAADFDRFGTAAQAELMTRLLDSDDPNALAILARSTRLLSPAAQRQLAQFWVDLPEDSALPIAQLISVMGRHASPMMRGAAIDALSGPRAQGSLDILSRIAAANIKAPLRTNDAALLARALSLTPHPAVIDTLSQNGGEGALPIIARALTSGDILTTQRAYSALYADNREDAFRALVATLYDLRADQTDVALAFSAMLRARHAGRADGFYMSFASDLMLDPEMSAAGRMVGFDAFLQTVGPDALARRVSDAPTAVVAQNFRAALNAYTSGGAQSIPAAYFDVVPLLAGDGDKADIWLSALRDALTSHNNNDQDLEGAVLLTTLAGRFDTALAANIVRDSLNAPQDYRRLSAALIASAAQSGGVLTAALTHPISHIAQAAELAQRAAKSDDPRAALARLSPKPISAFNRGADFCTVTPTDFKARAKSMPYFTGGTLPSDREALRGWLTTAERINGGWLAGYATLNDRETPEGALLAFDNKSGQSVDIFRGQTLPKGHGVMAIVPLNAATMQRPSREFWVVTAVIGSTPSPFPAAVYHLKMDARETQLRLAHTLPVRPGAIADNSVRGAQGSLSLSFGRAHPPLTLDSRRGLQKGCADTAGARKSNLASSGATGP